MSLGRFNPLHQAAAHALSSHAADAGRCVSLLARHKKSIAGLIFTKSQVSCQSLLSHFKKHLLVSFQSSQNLERNPKSPSKDAQQADAYARSIKVDECVWKVLLLQASQCYAWRAVAWAAPSEGSGGPQRAVLAQQADAVDNEAEDLELQQAPPQAPPRQLPGAVLQHPQRSNDRQHVGDVRPHQEVQVPRCIPHKAFRFMRVTHSCAVRARVAVPELAAMELARRCTYTALSDDGGSEKCRGSLEGLQSVCTCEEHALGGHAGGVDDEGRAHERQEGAHGRDDLRAAREERRQEYHYAACGGSYDHGSMGLQTLGAEHLTRWRLQGGASRSSLRARAGSAEKAGGEARRGKPTSEHAVEDADAEACRHQLLSQALRSLRLADLHARRPAQQAYSRPWGSPYSQQQPSLQ